MFAYKLIAIALAYLALWEALGRGRVRPAERRLQLQIYGAVSAFYILLVLITGGASATVIPGQAVPGAETLGEQCIRGFFGAFAVLFLVLGAVETGLGVAFFDPSMPLLSRWWVRALFEGPVWKLLSRRRPGTPLTIDEAESALRHTACGIITTAAAIWSAQVAMGLLEWGHLDPVALVIALRAINTWLDARLREPESTASTSVGCGVHGMPSHLALSRTSQPEPRT